MLEEAAAAGLFLFLIRLCVDHALASCSDVLLSTIHATTHICSFLLLLCAEALQAAQEAEEEAATQAAEEAARLAEEQRQADLLRVRGDTQCAFSFDFGQQCRTYLSQNECCFYSLAPQLLINLSTPCPHTETCYP